MPELSSSLPVEHPPARTRSAAALAVLLGGQLMIVLDITVMNVALPHIRADLGFTSSTLSWVMNAYTLVFGGLLLLGGRMGDRFGRRRLFVGGVALFTVASFAGGFADSAGWLLAVRAAQGLGAAFAGPSTLALLTSTFPEPGERTRALALFSGISSGGFGIGLILGGLLTELTSWRAVLFINVPVGIAIVALAARFVVEPPRKTGRLDLPGALVGTAGMAALVYGFIRAASSGWGDPTVVAAMILGALALIGFVGIERRVGEPLVPLRLFADRNRAAAYLNFFVGPMAMMSMFYFLTQYLQDIDRLTPLATGFAFLPMPIAIFTMTRLIPWVLPRFGPRTTAVAGSLLMIAGLAWLTQLQADSDYVTGLLGPMVLMGLGGGLGFAPLNVVIMSSVAPEDAGAAGGVLQTMQQLGGTLGLAILVTVFGAASRDAFATGANADQALVAGMTDAFTTSMFLAVLTLIVAASFRRQPSRT